MIRLYVFIFVLGIIGTLGYGAKYYYDTTQNTIATLRENNVRLENAVETAEASLELVKDNMEKVTELNTQLQQDLQKAEAYGDELRGKLSRMNLVVEALRDSKVLEGKMNGATANLWRDFMSNTGNTNQYDLPSWLQRNPAGTRDQSGNEDGTSNDTNGSETEATTTE